jgi:uncharacterized protein (TIGR02246 family)
LVGATSSTVHCIGVAPTLRLQRMVASTASDPALLEAVEALDRAWRDGLAEEFGDLLAEDAVQLLNNQEAVVGREAIKQGFARTAAAFDLSNYAPEYDLIDVHGDHAYVLGSFDEVLRPGTGGPGRRVQGRLVVFWRREPNGRWRIVRFLTGRSAPDEPEA